MNRPCILFKCPNCGALPYGDQIELISRIKQPDYCSADSVGVTRATCKNCGSKEVTASVVSDEEYYEACRKANGEKPYVDVWEQESIRRVEETSKNASPEKLNRLLQLMKRYSRLQSLLILEYFDGQTNGTDEGEMVLIGEIYEILRNAKKDGKISESYWTEEDSIVANSLPYSIEEAEDAVAKIMKEENARKEPV